MCEMPAIESPTQVMIAANIDYGRCGRCDRYFATLIEILAFFFDPEGPHGLSSLFLDALVGAVDVEGVEEGLGGNISVEREVFTGAGNRIDLLIKSDSHAVLIEIKIFAAVSNPFEDYAAYLRSLKNESGAP
jgi:hypothetical protein